MGKPLPKGARRTKPDSIGVAVYLKSPISHLRSRWVLDAASPEKVYRDIPVYALYDSASRENVNASAEKQDGPFPNGTGP